MTHTKYIITDVAVYDLRDVSSVGKQDPFVRFELGDSSAKTTVDKKAGVEASWDETLELTGRGSELIIKCFNKNTLWKDGLVGEAVVPLRSETSFGSGSTGAPSRAQLHDPRGNPAGTVTFTMRQQQGGVGGLGDRGHHTQGTAAGAAGVTQGMGRVNLDKDTQRHHGTEAGVAGGALGTGVAAHEAHKHTGRNHTGTQQQGMTGYTTGSPGYDMGSYTTTGTGATMNPAHTTGAYTGVQDQGQHHHHHHHGAEAGMAGGALGTGVAAHEAHKHMDKDRLGHTTTGYDTGPYGTTDTPRTGGIMKSGQGTGDYTGVRDQGKHHHHHHGTEAGIAGGALGTGVAAHEAHKHMDKDRTTIPHSTTGHTAGSPGSAYDTTTGYTAGDINAPGRTMGGQYDASSAMPGYGNKGRTTDHTTGDVTRPDMGSDYDHTGIHHHHHHVGTGIAPAVGAGMAGTAAGTGLAHEHHKHTGMETGTGMGSHGVLPGPGEHRGATNIQTGTGYNTTEPTGLVGGQTTAGRGQPGFGPGTDMTRDTTQGTDYRSTDPVRGNTTGIAGGDRTTEPTGMAGGQTITGRGQPGFGPGTDMTRQTGTGHRPDVAAVSESAEKREEEGNQPSILEQAKASISSAFDSAKGKVVGASDQPAGNPRTTA